MKEEFNAAFLNKRLNGNDIECKENTAEFKMNENFYNGLFEKLKTLCIQEKSDLKSNVKKKTQTFLYSVKIWVSLI